MSMTASFLRRGNWVNLLTIPIFSALALVLLIGCNKQGDSAQGKESSATPAKESGSDGAKDNWEFDSYAKADESALALCKLLSAGDVQNTLGFGKFAGLKMKNIDNITVCYYGDLFDKDRATIRFEGPISASKFAENKKGFTSGEVIKGMEVLDLSGFGDKAYSAELKEGKLYVGTVVAVKGGKEVNITCTAPLEKQKTLMLKLLAKL